jgi:hypothetical protein
MSRMDGTRAGNGQRTFRIASISAVLTRPPARYYFWYRIGIALIPDLFVTTISVFLIIDVLPALSFHPIFALIVSVSMFFLYVAICAINISLVAANEIGLINVESWYSITYGEAMFQVILALCYLAMFVYSCIAVHKWRMAKNCANLALSIANRETYDIGGGE